MTYKENITAILECHFTGFKQEIIDNAVNCISALSADGEYIKKSELFGKTVRRNSIWNEVTNSEGKGLEDIVNDLPSYSFPDSADIEKIQTEILEKMADYVASGYANSAEDFEEYSRIVIQTFNEHIGGKDK